MSNPSDNTPTPLDALPPRRRIFVEAYVRLLNATEAAREAGYKSPNVEGSRLLTFAGVMQAVRWLFEKRITERYKDKVMSKDEMLERLTEMARTDLGDFLGEGTEQLSDGSTRKVLYPTLDLNKVKARGKLHLIKSIRPCQWGLIVEFHDVYQAMRLLARMRGYEAPIKQEVSGNLTVTPEFDLSKLTDAEVSTLNALLNKAKRDNNPDVTTEA